MTYHHFCVTLSSLTISLAFLLHFSPTGLTMAYDLLKDKTRQFIVSEKYLLLRPPDRNERGRIEYKTSYACDGNVLGLSCRPNESISLVRANYGRFSLSICNDGGKLDLRVNCMSFRSYLIMQDRCSGKSKCNATVSSDLFGDPCHGTPKYLEVQYHCVQNNPSSSSSPSSSFSLSSSSSSFSSSSSVTTTTTRRPPTDTALPVHPWILRPSTKPSDRETGLLPPSPVITTTTTVRPTTTTAVPVYQFSLRPSTSFDWDFGSPSTSFSSPPSSSNDNQDDDGSPDSHHQRHHHHDRNKENNSNDNYNSNSNINPPSVESSSSSSTFNLPGDENLSINWLREVVIIGMSALCFLFILVILYTFSRLKEAQTSTPDLYESTVSEVIVPKWAAYTVVTV